MDQKKARLIHRHKLGPMEPETDTTCSPPPLEDSEPLSPSTIVIYVQTALRALNVFGRLPVSARVTICVMLAPLVFHSVISQTLSSCVFGLLCYIHIRYDPWLVWFMFPLLLLTHT